jgi:hypothetical protein
VDDGETDNETDDDKGSGHPASVNISRLFKAKVTAPSPSHLVRPGCGQFHGKTVNCPVGPAPAPIESKVQGYSASKVQAYPKSELLQGYPESEVLAYPNRELQGCPESKLQGCPERDPAAPDRLIGWL